MTRAEILEVVRENLYNPYLDLKKVKDSPYYVNCVGHEIGKVAFDNDYDLTTEELNEMVEEYFSVEV